MHFRGNINNCLPGEIWWADAPLLIGRARRLFDPELKKRPVLIVDTTDSESVLVIPGSGRHKAGHFVRHLYPKDYFFLKKPTHFLCSELQEIPRKYLRYLMGKIPDEQLQELVLLATEAYKRRYEISEI